MKKKWLLALTGVALTMALAACTGDNGEEKATESKAEETATKSDKKEEVKKEAKQPLDLVGEWKQVDGNSEESYQRATIQDGQIEIFWVDEAEGTESLYWAGTYVAPETTEDTYTWDSVNDKEKTDIAILASGDDTKTFTYEKGTISYSVSAMGMTQTVKLEKAK